MMFRGVALRRLHGFTRGVTDDIAARGAAQHGSRCAPARVFAMREAKFTPAFRAASSRLGLTPAVAGHGRKRTASSTQNGWMLAG